MISPSFAGVILAAGASSRMGSDKALLTWRGKTFLSAAIERLTPVTQLVIVVAGRNADAIKSQVYAHGGFLIVNPEPELGQFSSLRLGMQEVLNRGRDAALVALVDRPPAEPATLEKLIHNFKTHARESEAVAKWVEVPEYQGKHGHPIVVGREFIEVLLKADAQSTARDVEHAHQDRIHYVSVDDPNVVANVNTPEEYEILQKLHVSH